MFNLSLLKIKHVFYKTNYLCLIFEQNILNIFSAVTEKIIPILSELDEFLFTNPVYTVKSKIGLEKTKIFQKKEIKSGNKIFNLLQ